MAGLRTLAAADRRSDIGLIPMPPVWGARRAPHTRFLTLFFPLILRRFRPRQLRLQIG